MNEDAFWNRIERYRRLKKTTTESKMEKLTRFDIDLYNEIYRLSVKIEGYEKFNTFDRFDLTEQRETYRKYKDLIPRIEQELNRLFSDYNKFKSVKVFQYFLDINNFLITHGFKVWIFKEWELENLNDSSNYELSNELTNKAINKMKDLGILKIEKYQIYRDSKEWRRIITCYKTS